MTDFREPPIDFHGLKISIFTEELKPFYLTGEKPLFKVRVYNPGTDKIDGYITIVWKLNNLSNIHKISIDIPPRETREYELPREWCFAEGTSRYYIQDLGDPGSRYDEETEKKLLEKKEIHPLCGYYVYDREIYGYEKKEHEERLRHDHDMHQYTRDLKLYTIVILIFTMFIFLKDINFAQILWQGIKNNLSGTFNFIDTIIGFAIAILTTLLLVERDVVQNKDIEVTKDQKLIFVWNSNYYKDKKIWINNIGEGSLSYYAKLKELDLDQTNQTVSSKNMRSIKFREIFDEYEPTGKIEIYGHTNIEKSKVRFICVGKISRLGQIINWLEDKTKRSGLKDIK